MLSWFKKKYPDSANDIKHTYGRVSTVCSDSVIERNFKHQKKKFNDIKLSVRFYPYDMICMYPVYAELLYILPTKIKYIWKKTTTRTNMSTRLFFCSRPSFFQNEQKTSAELWHKL